MTLAQQRLEGRLRTVLAILALKRTEQARLNLAVRELEVEAAKLRQDILRIFIAEEAAL